jgi:hypothetical protein
MVNYRLIILGSRKTPQPKSKDHIKIRMKNGEKLVYGTFIRFDKQDYTPSIVIRDPLSNENISISIRSIKSMYLRTDRRQPAIDISELRYQRLKPTIVRRKCITLDEVQKSTTRTDTFNEGPYRRYKFDEIKNICQHLSIKTFGKTRILLVSLLNAFDLKRFDLIPDCMINNCLIFDYYRTKLVDPNDFYSASQIIDSTVKIHDM